MVRKNRQYCNCHYSKRLDSLNGDILFYVIAAEMKTHGNRYLLIATSGGLNQQRTGVSLSQLTYS